MGLNLGIVPTMIGLSSARRARDFEVFVAFIDGFYREFSIIIKKGKDNVFHQKSRTGC